MALHIYSFLDCTILTTEYPRIHEIFHEKKKWFLKINWLSQEGGEGQSTFQTQRGDETHACDSSLRKFTQTRKEHTSFLPPAQSITTRPTNICTGGTPDSHIINTRMPGRSSP